MMDNKSPAQPKYEASHYDDYGFDLQQDFSLFLEEAKQHGQEAKLKSSSVYPAEESGKTGFGKGEKGKKSWKSSLISWWKADQKSKLKEEHTNSRSKVSGKKKSHVSGPIHNSSCKGPDGRKQHRLPLSGPLTSLFKPTKRQENEIPYMSLHQRNSSQHAVQNYGPLYVVTCVLSLSYVVANSGYTSFSEKDLLNLLLQN